MSRLRVRPSINGQLLPNINGRTGLSMQQFSAPGAADVRFHEGCVLKFYCDSGGVVEYPPFRLH